MMKKFLFLCLIVVTMVSCQFTETMVLNEDGTGTMSVELDMREMMAFGAGMGPDTTSVKMDSIIHFKDVLREKKDSIAQLPADKQKRLKAMENYKMNIKMDTDAGEMMFNISTDFKNIDEANELMGGLDAVGDLVPNPMGGSDTSMESDMDEEDTEKDDTNSSDVMGVRYSYKKGVFKRDAYIKDKEAHQKQKDSMASAEAFMSSMKYKIKYTFPRKIVKSSIEDATYSLDGKTIELERSFIDYFKNPDVLDIEVELENN